MMVRVLQINLHYCEAATAPLLQMSSEAEDLALIQKPWVIRHKICGLKIIKQLLVSSATNGKTAFLLAQTTKFSFFLNIVMSY